VKETEINVFNGLRDGLRDAVAYERGRKVSLHVTEIPHTAKGRLPEGYPAHFRWQAIG
jgi:hypothetical protein